MLAELWLILCKNTYNAALEQRIYARRQRKQISKFDQINQLPDLKKEHPEFKIVGSQVLQNVIERVDLAFQGFFRRSKAKQEKAGFPRFKSSDRYDSFTLKQAGWNLEGKYLIIRNIGRLKLFKSRPIEGTIKTVTVRRTRTGKWFVSFSCDNVLARKFPYAEKKVGIDVGLNHFLTDSDGNHVENPRYFRKSEKQLRRRNRKLHRRKNGSKRRNKARVLVAKAHEKVTNQRKDFLHKTANAYIKEYNIICVEKLHIRNMVRNRNLSKSISDASWGRFIDYLTYKAEEARRRIIKVPPHNTSQECSGCGETVKKSLSVRTHRCPHCGLVLCRDHNSALNILRAGQALQSLTTELSGVD